MTKEFQNAIADLKQLLVDKANGRYFVVGHTKQRSNAEELRGKKMVQVFYSGGSFNRGTSSMNSETTHNAIASVILTVSEPSTMDLAVLENPSSTPEQIALALTAGREAEDVANEAMDELFGIMFDIIMGADGEHFGNESDDYSIADRWGRDFKKDPVLSGGSVVVINGSYDIQFTVREIPDGDTPIEGNFMSGAIDIQKDSGDPLYVEQGEE